MRQRQRQIVAAIGAIALTVSGCGSEESNPPAAVSPSPVPAPAVKQKTAVQPFAKPLVAQKPPAPGSVPGLIQSTNGDERARQVQASISKAGKDPFALLPIEIPKLQGSPSRTNVPAVPRLIPTRPATSALKPNPPRPSRPFPLNPPSGPSIAKLPPLPSADLANGVEVSGVVRVGNAVQAIVHAPNEPTSRYVGIGQRLSNGQVLVKRIELNAGADPVVILEENGVEVPRVVGAKPVQPQKPGDTPQPPGGSA